jgi:uncharacterized small protein (DUF1192 family)
MAVDIFADELTRPKPAAHEVGEDLSTLSIVEIDERIEVLEREIQRLRDARGRKEASKDAASAFFRL